jgi:hypothetical protein
VSERSKSGSTKQLPIAKYIYKNEAGKNHIQVLRYPNKSNDKKDFRQYHWANKRWVLGLDNCRKIPYRLPEILRAKGKRVYLVEGEKDADTLAERGYSVSCTRSSPSVFQASWVKYFKDVASVIIIADKDRAGHREAKRAYDVLEPHIPVKIFECTQGKDVTEHLENGGQLKGKGQFVDVTVAVTAEAQATKGVATNGHATTQGWTPTDMAQWALDKLQTDASDDEEHAGRENIAWKFAQQLRDVPREVAEAAMRIYAKNVPGYDSDGRSKPYTVEQAMTTLRSALDNPAPESWTPGTGVFSKPPPNESVEKAAERLRINRQARRIIDDEEAAELYKPAPTLSNLTAELAIDEGELQYTIRDLHVTGGNTVLQAQFKTGKTTLLLNLLRALLDDCLFLGEKHVWRDGPVAYWNYELSPRQFRKWLRDMKIKHTDEAHIWNLRGHRLPLTVSYIQEEAVEWLRSRGVKVLVIDPFMRAYGGNENDNTEMNRWLDTLDVVKEQAGVVDLFMAHHMGRAEFEEGGERGRGASRLDDWLDHRWMLTRDKEGSRYFRADGRDVDFLERQLGYDAGTHTLYLEGGSRAQVRVERLLQEDVQAVIDLVRENPDIGATQLKAQLEGRKQRRDAAVKEAVRLDLVQEISEGVSKRYRVW